MQSVRIIEADNVLVDISLGFPKPFMFRAQHASKARGFLENA